jgi:hypothetical protein
MLLQSKMIEEWSRENAMTKVSMPSYIHFFQESTQRHKVVAPGGVPENANCFKVHCNWSCTA